MSACPTCTAANPDGARFCASCGSPLAPLVPLVTREVRKTVTILFADVTGSTALGEQLDPESLRAIMGRYFTMMKAVIESHGGTVEKFIGDAVMAVFGIPVVHEDDALRAVRAAAAIKDQLEALNAELLASRGIAIRFRTGVNTGEVVAGDPATGQTLVTGDTVNTAARLEQAAPPGEILLGAVTWSLVRDAVRVEPVEPIAAKGKAAPVAAYRLIAIRAGADAHVRHLERPLIGRQRELTVLRGAFERTVAERSCQLFSLLGPAGVGKSRLVAEFLASVSGEATVLKGRCLPYGEGITYWPLRDIVLAAAGIDEADDAAASLAKLEALVAAERDGPLISAALAAAIGLSSASIPQEEIFWAARKLLEGRARERPLVVLVEDIHWAEGTLLDLLEYVADLARDAPLLILCPARPELLDRRTGWGGGKLNATTILLEPLGSEAAAELIGGLPGGSALPEELRTRIIAAAEGNPLYVEEMLGMLIDDGRVIEIDGAWQTRGDLGEVTVPPSISALLAARLDALAPLERAIAERASVVGRVFELAAVAELASDALRPEVARGLIGLVRKELIRPERSELAAGDAFKFRHLLIRDAAYEALPKSERAELHERFADWLERVAGDRLVEYEEVLGHHFEQAHSCRIELGQTGPRVERLAERATLVLIAAGRRARDRADPASGAELLGRAWKLQPAGTIQIELFRDYGDVLIASGQDDEVSALLANVGRAVEAQREPADDWVQLFSIDLKLQATVDIAAQVAALRALVDRFKAADDDRGVARALYLIGYLLDELGQVGIATATTLESASSSRRAGDLAGEGKAYANYALQLVDGPTPVAEAIGLVEQVMAREHPHRRVEADALQSLGELHVLRGDVASGLQAARTGLEINLEVGTRWDDDVISLFFFGRAQFRADDHHAAAETAALALDKVPAQNADSPVAQPVAALLARALRSIGRTDEALRVYRSWPAGQSSSFRDRISSLSLAALMAADEQRYDSALDSASRAVRLAEATDGLVGHAEALIDLAEVQIAAQNLDAARQSFRSALELHRRKGSHGGEAVAKRRLGSQLEEQ